MRDGGYTKDRNTTPVVEFPTTVKSTRAIRYRLTIYLQNAPPGQFVTIAKIIAMPFVEQGILFVDTSDGIFHRFLVDRFASWTVQPYEIEVE